MAAPAGTRRGLILDRDGVINEEVEYLHRVADCRFVPGIFDMTAAFARHGFVIAIATNQSGIGRGYFTEKDFEEFMAWMRAEFARRGIPIAAVYHCPDHPTEGIGAFRRDSPRRKPGPGMLLEAARELGLDLARSWTVGERKRDIDAGRAAGVGTLVLYDPLAREPARCDDFWVVPRLSDVADLLAKEAG